MRLFKFDLVPNYWYGFCPSETVWVKEVAKLGMPKEAYPSQDACCVHFKVKDARFSLVTVSNEQRTGLQLVGLLTHEAMHIWRNCREIIGEQFPSEEFEAYMMQKITQDLCTAYNDTRREVFV